MCLKTELQSMQWNAVILMMKEIQKGEPGEIVDIVFLTHKAKEGDTQEALKEVARLDCVEKICNVIRVVEI